MPNCYRCTSVPQPRGLSPSIFVPVCVPIRRITWLSPGPLELFRSSGQRGESVFCQSQDYPTESRAIDWSSGRMLTICRLPFGPLKDACPSQMEIIKGVHSCANKLGPVRLRLENSSFFNCKYWAWPRDPCSSNKL